MVIVSNYFKNLGRAIAGKRSVDLSGSHSIFGTLGKGAFPILSKMGFIPTDGKGGTLSLIGDPDREGSASWIGLDSKIMQYWAYVYCTPLAAVIDRLAEADTNGIVTFIDADTKVPIKNVSKVPRLNRIKRLLKRPNPWQTWEEFDGEQLVLCKIFGYCPVFAIGPGFEDKSHTTALVNLNPAVAEPIRNDEFSLYKKDSSIKAWKITIVNKDYEIPSKDIILIKDGFLTNKEDGMNLPLSKIKGMDFFISNICAAMEAQNVILKKKGPLGIWSFDPGKDMAGTTPYVPEYKDELQRDLAQYGLTLGQLQQVISPLPVKWQPTSFPLKDLMTKEVIRDAIDGICDRFGYPAELMSGKNATYENRHTSERFLYQNNVIPFSLRRMTRYNEFFGLEEVILNKEFDHLAVLQEDIVKAGEAAKYEAEALEIEWKNGQLTWNQWQIARGRDPVAGMDIFYPEYLKKYPAMNPANQKPKDNGKKTPPKDTGAKG